MIAEREASCSCISTVNMLNLNTSLKTGTFTLPKSLWLLQMKMKSEQRSRATSHSQEQKIQYGGMLARTTLVGYWKQLLQLVAGEEEKEACERNRKEGKGRESCYGWKEDKDGKGDGWKGRRGVSRGGGLWSVYPALSSRRPLWSWVGCEGGVRRREEEEDGEEEEGPRPGPRLTPQTVKWDLQQKKMKQRRSNQISLEMPPAPQTHTHADRLKRVGWWVVWPDEMRSGGSQTV